MVQYPPGTSKKTNLTNYKIVLLYSKEVSGETQYFNPTTSLNTSRPLVYLPETVSASIEASLQAPSNKEDVLSNPYYYIRNVDTLCQMINKAIIDYFVSDISNGTWVHKPYFQWDSASQKLVFNRPNSIPSGVPGPDATSQWYVAVNQPLYNLLSTFRFKFFPQNAGNDGIYPETTDCRYLLDTNVLLPEQEQTIGDYTAYLQQSSSVVNWSPCQSIVFVSSTIPVEAQFSGAPVNLNSRDSSTQSNIYQQQSVVKVLTDFIIPFNSGVEATNSQVYYIPQSEYRLIDLLGNSNLQQLTIQAFWRDKYGVYHPMTLDAGGSADILIMLRKKSFNNQATTN
jgi:hypothetical protein